MTCDLFQLFFDLRHQMWQILAGKKSGKSGNKRKSGLDINEQQKLTYECKDCT